MKTFPGFRRPSIPAIPDRKASLVFFLGFGLGFAFGQDPDRIGSEGSRDAYPVDSAQPKSILFESRPYRYDLADSQPAAAADSGKEDILELPAKSTKLGKNDSMGKAFKEYWAKVEKEEGIDKLRAQLQAQSIDRTWVPHFYLFDSNLVIFPGWFVIRKKR